MRLRLLAAATLAATLAGCHHATPARPDDQRAAEGKILPGVASLVDKV